MSIIKTEHLVHNYIIKTSTMDINTIHVLKDIDFEVEKRGIRVDHGTFRMRKEYLS